MKKILFFAVLFICFSTVLCAQSEKELFDSGIQYFKQGQHQKALDTFTKLIELDPKNADAYKNRGVTYMKLEKFDSAIKDFGKAEELFPELKGLYSNLGVAWYYKKEYVKAIKSYDIEIEMSPENHIAYFNRALCLTELGQNQKALDDLSKTLEIKPDFYWAICYKADILSDEGNDIEAIETYEEAIQKFPKNIYAVDKLSQLRKKITNNTQDVKRPDQASKQTAKQTQNDSIDLSNAPVKIDTPPTQRKESLQKPAQDPGQKKGHALQLGAFLSSDNAQRMKRKLISNGFDSRVLVLKDAQNRIWHMVRSGNYPNKKATQNTAASLKQKLGLSSIVRPYGTW